MEIYLKKVVSRVLIEALVDCKINLLHCLSKVAIGMMMMGLTYS
jgi:hypothetical protein